MMTPIYTEDGQLENPRIVYSGHGSPASASTGPLDDSCSDMEVLLLEKQDEVEALRRVSGQQVFARPRPSAVFNASVREDWKSFPLSRVSPLCHPLHFPALGIASEGSSISVCSTKQAQAFRIVTDPNLVIPPSNTIPVLRHRSPRPSNQHLRACSIAAIFITLTGHVSCPAYSSPTKLLPQ